MSENKQKLTRSFCENNVLLFYPKTKAEATFIQKQLFSMGFSWYRGGKTLSTLANCISTGMVLDSDGDLLTNPSDSNKEIGSVYTANDFETHFDHSSLEVLSGDTLMIEIFNRTSLQIEELKKEIEELKNPSYRTLEKPKQKKSRDYKHAKK